MMSGLRVHKMKKKKTRQCDRESVPHLVHEEVTKTGA